MPRLNVPSIAHRLQLRPPVATAIRARARFAATLMVLAMAVGCSSGTEPGDDEPATPGVVIYRLSSPNGAEGALLFEAPSAEVVSVPDAQDALMEVVSRRVGDAIHVAVVHRFGVEGMSFALEVADTAHPPALSLVQVAGPDDRLRSLSGYALQVVS